MMAWMTTLVENLRSGWESFAQFVVGLPVWQYAVFTVLLFLVAMVWLSSRWQLGRIRRAIRQVRDAKDSTRTTAEARAFGWFGWVMPLLKSQTIQTMQDRGEVQGELESQLDRASAGPMLRQVVILSPLGGILLTVLTVCVFVHNGGDLAKLPFPHVLSVWMGSIVLALLCQVGAGRLLSLEMTCRDEAMAWFDAIWKPTRNHPASPTPGVQDLTDRVQDLGQVIRALREQLAEDRRTFEHLAPLAQIPEQLHRMQQSQNHLAEATRGLFENGQEILTEMRDAASGLGAVVQKVGTLVSALETGVGRFLRVVGEDLVPAAEQQRNAASVFESASRSMTLGVEDLTDATATLKTQAEHLGRAVEQSNTLMAGAQKALVQLTQAGGEMGRTASALQPAIGVLTAAVTQAQSVADEVARVIGSMTESIESRLASLDANALLPMARELKRVQRMFRQMRQDLDLSGLTQEFRDAVNALGVAALIQENAASDAQQTQNQRRTLWQRLTFQND